ncbi:unnamed protein product, partial [Polarella glacialis]
MTLKVWACCRQPARAALRTWGPLRRPSPAFLFSTSPGARSFGSEVSFCCAACGKQAESFGFLCRSCGSLMEARYGESSHFALLGLETRFEVDLAAVDAAYKGLQKSLHPDKHAQAGEEQRELAQTHSARLNEAVNVL